MPPIEATGIFGNSAVRAAGTDTREIEPQENRLKQTNIWDYSNYFNGGIGQTAHNA